MRRIFVRWGMDDRMTMTSSPVMETLKGLLALRQHDVKQWLETRFDETPPSFYSSVDLRHSGTKLAPVDTNLFPAGFNNLSSAARKRAVERVKQVIAAYEPTVRRILIVPENHTRNLGYLDNLLALKQIIEAAGFEVQLGSLQAEAGQPLELEGSQGEPMVQYPLVKDNGRLGTQTGFVPDLIIMNNDMTSGLPELLTGLSQLVVPPLGQGWYRRKKSIHFDAYEQVSRQFAQHFSIDPWLISAIFHKCGRVDFGERLGIECMALGVEKVLRAVREKYAEYGITEEPYVFVKADSGTYGMGIMTVRSGEELYEMNKKNRNKMNVIKEGVQSTEVIIQEGIPTVDAVEGAQAEPMIYLVGGVAIGGAFRVNDERDRFNNLNARGMRFTGMCDEAEYDDELRHKVKNCDFGVYGLIASLATLAAAREEYGDGYMI